MTDSKSSSGSEVPSTVSLLSLRNPALWYAAVLCACLLGTVFFRSLDPDAFNHDVGQMLHFAGRMLDGSRLYVDLVDENPPLIFWLSVPPVALARYLGLPPIVVFDLAVALLAFASAAICFLILRRTGPGAPQNYQLAVIALLLCLEILQPGYDYGQRENILFILVVPYLLSAAAREAKQRLPGRLGAVVGMLAGIGLALKPHFIVLWLVVEGWLVMRGCRGWRCVENVLIVGIGVGYLLAIVLFAGAYFDVVKMAIRVLPSYAETGVLGLLLPMACVHVALAMGLFALTRSTPLDAELRRVLLVASIGLLMAAILQGKGWSYHYYPASAAALLLMGVIALGLVSHGETLRSVLRPSATVLPALALILLIVWSGGTLLLALSRDIAPPKKGTSLVRLLAKVVRDRAKGESIWLMSTSVNPAFPVVNLTGVHWSSRFCCLWLLPGSYSAQEKSTRPFPYHDRNEMGEIERYQLDSVIEDLERDPPKLLIADQSPLKQALGRSDFQYLTYFRRDPRFSELFRNYRLALRVGAFAVFERRASGE